LRVIIVGGIFGRPTEFRTAISKTPETNLLEGLLDRGIAARGVPHTWLPGWSRADIVHLHHLAKGVLAYTCARPLLAKRLVFTRHGLEGDLSAARRSVLAAVHRRADAVIALSEFEAKVLDGQVRGRLEVIPNGIDGEFRGTRGDPPQRTDRRRLLYVGQLIPLKNLDLLLYALADVRRSVDIELRLVYHNAWLEPELRELSEQLGLADRVTFMGRCGPKQLLAEYAMADALVLPSANEALPSVVTEALMAGRPVVASAVGGIPEQVADAGILVPPGDTGALAAALRALVADYDRYAEAATARSRQVVEEYSVHRMIDRHVRLYEELLGSRDGQRSSS
jgi:glycosyltransferase involved in cell wall biosynthesis